MTRAISGRAERGPSGPIRWTVCGFPVNDSSREATGKVSSSVP